MRRAHSKHLIHHAPRQAEAPSERRKTAQGSSEGTRKSTEGRDRTTRREPIAQVSTSPEPYTHKAALPTQQVACMNPTATLPEFTPITAMRPE